MTVPTPADPDLAAVLAAGPVADDAPERPRTVVLTAVVVGVLGAVYIALGARGRNEDSSGGGLLLMLGGIAHLAAAPGLLRGHRPTRVYAVLLATGCAVGALAANLSDLTHYGLLAGAAVAVALLTLFPPVRAFFDSPAIDDAASAEGPDADGVRMGE